MTTSYPQSRQMVLLVAFTALAIPAYAVDGVVLINQNAALAGNITPCDAPGFPVTISVAGSYRLSGNLTVPDENTTAILITAENVAIDLNGFSILGPTVCSGFPVACTPTGSGTGVFGSSDLKNITVLNGDIRGMGRRGIFLQGAGHRIKEVRASNNGSDGIVAFGIVQSCSANSNGRSGVVTSGSVIDSVAIGNHGEGLELINQSGIAVNNLLISNDGNGTSGQATFTGNFALGNGKAGILAFCFSSVVSNTALNNFGGDILTSGSGCARANNSPAP